MTDEEREFFVSFSGILTAIGSGRSAHLRGRCPEAAAFDARRGIAIIQEALHVLACSGQTASTSSLKRWLVRISNDGCESQNGQVAQLVERSPEKAGVGGSIPSLATINFTRDALSLQISEFPKFDPASDLAKQIKQLSGHAYAPFLRSAAHVQPRVLG